MQHSDFSPKALWSIRPDNFTQLAEQAAEMHSRTDLHETLTAFNAAINNRAGGKSKPYRVDQGVAVIPVTGPLTKRLSFFSFFFGGSSYDQLTAIVNEALDDPQVNAILLDIDSPGGTVAGTQTFGEIIFSARERKPVVALANGMMTSAAYWIGSAAHTVITEPTSELGSIGVLQVHYDYSRMDQKDGVKRTYITAGKYKAIGNSAEPLSEFARATIQADLDYLYGLFIETVARNRGIDADAVREDMADGRIFIGQQAVDNRLADAIGTYSDAIEKARSMAAGNAYPSTANKGVQTMTGEVTTVTTPAAITTVEQLAAAYPALAEQLRAQGAASVDQKQIGEQAAQTERERILALVGIQFGEEPGRQFSVIVNTNVTAEQLTAIRESTPAAGQDDSDPAMAAMLAAIQKTGASDPGSQTTGSGPADFTAAWKEIKAEKNCDTTKAMQLAAKQYPKLHEAFIASANKK